MPALESAINIDLTRLDTVLRRATVRNIRKLKRDDLITSECLHKNKNEAALTF